MVEDIITLVKGGVVDSSSGLLAIRNPETYKNWGATLKYNPTLVESEVNKTQVIITSSFYVLLLCLCWCSSFHELFPISSSCLCLFPPDDPDHANL